jgi:DNA-binding MarR family transcriptional regulator
MSEDQRVDAIRSFNRFYTRQIGLLQNGYLNSSFSLTEMRVFYELANRKQTTAGDIARELDIDAGYLSRLLLRLQKRGYLRKVPSEQDGRQTLLSLTKKGQKDFTVLNARSQRRGRAGWWSL